jgi:uncharacterized membrane protein
MFVDGVGVRLGRVFWWGVVYWLATVYWLARMFVWRTALVQTFRQMEQHKQPE